MNRVLTFIKHYVASCFRILYEICVTGNMFWGLRWSWMVRWQLMSRLEDIKHLSWRSKSISYPEYLSAANTRKVQSMSPVDQHSASGESRSDSGTINHITPWLENLLNYSAMSTMLTLSQQANRADIIILEFFEMVFSKLKHGSYLIMNKWTLAPLSPSVSVSCLRPMVPGQHCSNPHCRSNGAAGWLTHSPRPLCCQPGLE